MATSDGRTGSTTPASSMRASSRLASFASACALLNRFAAEELRDVVLPWEAVAQE